MTIKLDYSARTATLDHALTHTPPIKAPAEGNDQQLPNGNELVGWGQAPNAATEFNRAGRTVFDIRFDSPNASYRSYRYPWTATPRGRPVVATHTYRGQTSVSVSWNGTTTTHRWRVLAGARGSKLATVGTYRRINFESTIQTHRRLRGNVEVQALDTAGKVQATSRTVSVP